MRKVVNEQLDGVAQKLSFVFLEIKALGNLRLCDKLGTKWRTVGKSVF